MLPHPEDNQILSYATLEMLILLGWMGYIHIIFLLYYISYNYTLRIINMMAILYFRYGIEYRMID